MILSYHYNFEIIMTTQQQIDELLNDEWDDESSKITASKKSTVKENKPQLLQPAKPGKPAQNYEESNSYANEDFQEYDQSRRTQSYQQSQSESLPIKVNPPKPREKDKNLSKQLAQIRQQQPKKQEKKEQIRQANQNYIKPALDLRMESAITKKNKGSTITQDKVYLPHNFARLEERQRQLLLTSLSEDNKRLKTQILERENNYKKLQQKYKMLLQQKAQNTSTAKELALQKQVTNLKTKLQQMHNLQKIADERQKYKTKISKNPGVFVPEEQVSRRQQQLLDLIEKLKKRLIESDESLGVLQKKVNQGAEYNDQLHRKIKRVEQLEYKIEKMTEQAQTDREYTDILKQKVKDLQKQVDEQKSRYRKLQIQMKRTQMGQLTHNDIIKQLQEVKKQKQLLQKSLKEMSSTMMGKVMSNYQRIPGNRIEDSGQLLNPQGASR